MSSCEHAENSDINIEAFFSEWITYFDDVGTSYTCYNRKRVGNAAFVKSGTFFSD